MNRDLLVIDVAKKIVKESGVLGIDVEDLIVLGDPEEVANVIKDLVSASSSPFYLLENRDAKRIFYDKRVGGDVDDVIREVVYGKVGISSISSAPRNTTMDKVLRIVQREKSITPGVVVNRLRKIPRAQVLDALDGLVAGGQVKRASKTLGNGKVCDFYEPCI